MAVIKQKNEVFYDWFNYVVQFENGSIGVYSIVQGSVLGDLRAAASQVNFKYKTDWDAEQLVKELIKKYGYKHKGQHHGTLESAFVGDYLIDYHGGYELYIKADNTKAKLTELAKKIGLKIEEKWNTQTLGKKVIDKIKETKK